MPISYTPQLKEANEKLSAKSNEVVALETKMMELEASLSEAIVDARTKTSSLEQLRISKQSSDADIRDLKARLQQVHAERSQDLAARNSASKEVGVLLLDPLPF